MSFETSVLQALRLMPRHRARASRRAATLGLDDLIDEARSQGALDPGALDLLLMGTRYGARARRELDKFLKGKPLKPSEMEDLFVLIFAALLSRDRSPKPVQLNTFVEIAAKSFGNHLKGLVNAWGRQVLRDSEKLDAERLENPVAWLPELWRERWKSEPELLKRAARETFERPAPGVWAFGPELELAKKPLADWQAAPPFQAMDPGSWRLVKWIDAELSDKRSENFLDACAAPGGKFIALSLLRASRGLKRALATDAKFGRVERLNRNVAAWKARLPETCETRVLAWGEDEVSAELSAVNWDLVLADLPCSGSGTLATRPDLLDQDPFARLSTLTSLQEKILASLRELKSRHLFVSICSVDPEEIAKLSACLGREPDFSSWTEEASADEGLTAWHIADPAKGA